MIITGFERAIGIVPLVLTLLLSTGVIAKQLQLTKEEEEFLKGGSLAFDTSGIEEPSVSDSTAQQSEYDVDVYFTPLAQDWSVPNEKWAEACGDLSPVDKVIDGYGNNGYCAPVELVWPSKHLLTSEEAKLLKEEGLTFDALEGMGAGVADSVAQQSEYDIDVYLIPSVQDWLDQNVRWTASCDDLSPLDKITDSYGNKGYRIPAEFVRPSEHFEGQWYADVHVRGYRTPSSHESESEVWIDVDQGIAVFNERIYIDPDGDKTWNYTRFLPYKGLSLTESIELVESAYASTPHAVYIYMKNFDDIKVILSASMKEHYAGEDETDSGRSVLPAAAPAGGGILSFGAFLLAGFFLFNTMGPAASFEPVKDYVYTYSRSY